MYILAAFLMGIFLGIPADRTSRLILPDPPALSLNRPNLGSSHETTPTVLRELHPGDV